MDFLDDLDLGRLATMHEAAQLIGAAHEARSTAARLTEVGCAGAAADCVTLATVLDEQATDLLRGEGS